MSRKVIHTDRAPAAIGPYSQAVCVNLQNTGITEKGQLLFCSGQIGLDPATGNLRDGFDAQVDQALANMQAVLAAAGATTNNVVKLTLFLTDLGNFAAANAKMEALFQKPYPARSTVGVASLPKGAQFEIEAIAAI